MTSSIPGMWRCQFTSPQPASRMDFTSYSRMIRATKSRDVAVRERYDPGPDRVSFVPSVGSQPKLS